MDQDQSRLTREPVGRLMRRYAVPCIISLLVAALYNIVDQIYIGWGVGAEGNSATNIVFPLTVIALAIATMIGDGACSFISIRLGAGDRENAGRAAGNAVTLSVLTGLVLMAVYFIFADPLLRLFGAGEDVSALTRGYARDYFLWIAAGIPFYLFGQTMNPIIRSDGSPRIAMAATLAGAVANIILDPIAIFVLHWGVAGAAIATTIAQLGSCLAGYLYMTKKYALFRFTRAQFRFHGDKCRLILNVGVPTALQQCVVSCGHILVQRLVNSYGGDMIAAFTASQRIEQYILVPIISYQNGISMYVGQNTGAGKPERVRTGFRQTALLSLLTCFVLAGAAFIFTPQLIRIFGVTGQAYDYGCEYLRSMAPCFLVFAVYLVVLGTLQGAGDVRVAMFCTMLALTVRVILSYALAYGTPLSYRAIWWSMVIGWVVAAVVAFWRYFSGRWMEKAVVKG